MSTNWVITAAAERVVLDEQRQGETTFTVTNSGDTADRAVLEVVPGDDADPGWFAVEDPQRLVRPGSSVAYLLRVAVSGDAPPGSYTVRGRVYSVDSPPEESSVLSPRVTLAVREEPGSEPWRPPWWMVAAAALVVLVLAVVGTVLVLRDQPSPGPAEVVMPNLDGMSERQALRALDEAGVTARPSEYRHDPEQAGTVVGQEPAADEVVARDTLAGLEVAVELQPPEVTSPDGAPVGQPDDEEPVPTLEWTAGGSPARAWRVYLFEERCRLLYGGPPDPAPAVIPISVECSFSESPDRTESVGSPSFAPSGLSFNRVVIVPEDAYRTGWVRWQVAAVDSFGAAGPPSELRAFRVPPGS